MGLVVSRYLDFAEPQGSRRQHGSGLPPGPRLAVAGRRAFAGRVGRDLPGAGWLGGWRSRFSSAGWPRRTPTAVRRQPAVPYRAPHLDALANVVARTQVLLAAQAQDAAHQAAPSTNP